MNRVKVMAQASHTNNIEGCAAKPIVHGNDRRRVSRYLLRIHAYRGLSGFSVDFSRYGSHHVAGNRPKRRVKVFDVTEREGRHEVFALGLRGIISTPDL